MSDDGSCITQSEDLGVGGGVAGQLAFVVAPGNHYTVTHNNRANGHVVMRDRGASLDEREIHHLNVDLHLNVGHSAMLSLIASPKLEVLTWPNSSCGTWMMISSAG